MFDKGPFFKIPYGLLHDSHLGFAYAKRMNDIQNR